MTGLLLALTLTASGQYLPEALKPPESSPPRELCVKTNALPWAMTVMNMELEAKITDRISITMPAMWCPWFISERHAFRVAALQPAGRWWLKRYGEGHFFGPHFSCAWFNIKYGDYRYQDRSRPALGAGVTYGYALRISHSWRIEFSIGAGWLSMQYDRFYNSGNGSLMDTRKTSYFGIDHAGISIAYCFEL